MGNYPQIAVLAGMSSQGYGTQKAVQANRGSKSLGF